MSNPSPICTVGGNPTPADVAANTVVSGGLASGAGANYWALSCTSTDDSSTAAAVNATLSLNQTNKTFSFTSLGLGTSYIFTSQVGIKGLGLDANGNYNPAFTTTFKVNVKSAGGFRVIAFNETTEQGAGGWISEYNAMARNMVNWRQIANYTAYWDQYTQVVSTGQVTQWGDGTGSGRNFITTSTNPSAVTINGWPALGFSNPTQQTLILTSSVSSPWTAASGWLVFVYESIGTLTADNANACLDQAIFGDSAGSIQMGLRATGPAMVCTISDSVGFKNTQTNITQNVVKIGEMWWDSSNVYCRVNGGTVSQTAAGAVAALPSQPWLGSGYYAHTSSNAAGWFNGYLLAGAALHAVPTNASTIVASMMAEYGAK